MLELPTPEDDGLLIPDVNDSYCDKHHFLTRYLDAFTTSMKDKRWSGRHYVDLFAGAGIERLKNSGQLIWGSALIAAHVRFPFTGIHLCELDAAKCDALSTRIRKVGTSSEIDVRCGDANLEVDGILERIPPRTLSVAFLDPCGLHLDYETLSKLATRRVDLIIFFPDRLDIFRNWKAYYWDNPDSNLDRVLGPDADWRAIAGLPVSAQVRAFLDLYEQQIRKLGYKYFDEEPIPSAGDRLYWLIFCSRAKIGLEIWRNVARRKPGGQRTRSILTSIAA